jgi:predicted acyltransferase
MSTQQRLTSLDALRGLTIIGMIIVNNPADWSAAYGPLLHSEWVGCTPTDLVFPFFLFIMGFSLFLSTQRRLQKGDSKGLLFRHLAKRSAVIFVIGLALNGFPSYHLDTLRILGVLQRIALVNFFCGTMLIYSSRSFRLFIGTFILLVYWILLSFIPSPLAGIPTLAYESNWVSWLDQLILGPHTWNVMPLMDPEGILSTFPAIVTALIGIEIALLFTKHTDKREKTVILFLSGFLLTAAGLIWSPVFPMVKKLWTSSYVLYTAGLAAMTLGAFYWLIDYQKKENTVKLLVAVGKNPLAIYVGSELMVMIIWMITIFGPEKQNLNGWLFKSLQASGISANLASLAWALSFTALWAIIAMILYRRKIIIKV